MIYKVEIEDTFLIKGKGQAITCPNHGKELSKNWKGSKIIQGNVEFNISDFQRWHCLGSHADNSNCSDRFSVLTEPNMDLRRGEAFIVVPECN